MLFRSFEISKILYFFIIFPFKLFAGSSNFPNYVRVLYFAISISFPFPFTLPPPPLSWICTSPQPNETQQRRVALTYFLVPPQDVRAKTLYISQATNHQPTNPFSRQLLVQDLPDIPELCYARIRYSMHAHRICLAFLREMSNSQSRPLYLYLCFFLVSSFCIFDYVLLWVGWERCE